MDKGNHDCERDSADGDKLAIVLRYHKSLEQSIARIFSEHAQCMEQVVFGALNLACTNSQTQPVTQCYLPSSENNNHSDGRAVPLNEKPLQKRPDTKMSNVAATEIEPGVARQISDASSSDKDGRWSSSTPAHAVSGVSVLSQELARGIMDATRKATPKPFLPCFWYILGSNAFEGCSVCCVICNAIVIGMQVDWSVRHIGEDLPSIFGFLELIFAITFACEWIIRILGSGRWFLSCQNDELNWNMFDTFLVLSSVMDLPFLRTGLNLTAARVLRLMRLVRVLRTVRLFRFFKMLRLVVHSVAASLKPLLWALLVLYGVIFITSVMVLQLVEDNPGANEKEFKNLFGSLLRTQYTLFSCSTNGMSWIEPADILIELSPLLGVVFLVYVSFTFFCVVNIVTSIFVETAKGMSQKDEELVLLEEAASRSLWLNEVRELFELADTDGSGCLTPAELEEGLRDMRIQVLLQNLGIDVLSLNPRGFFNAMDFDRSGRITIQEFADGVMRFHGGARSLDLAEVRHFVLQCLENVKSCREQVNSLRVQTRLASTNVPPSQIAL